MAKSLTAKKKLEGVNKPIAAEQTEEGKLIRALRGERTFRQCESYLNEKIPTGMPGTTTFQMIWNWEDGMHPVTPACLYAWKVFYSEQDPRHELAVKILALRVEKVVEFDIENGKKLMKKISLTTKGTKSHEGKIEVKA